MDKEERIEIYTEALEKVKESPHKQSEIYVHGVSALFGSSEPVHKFYGKEGSNSFDMEILFPPTLNPSFTLPDKCEVELPEKAIKGAKIKCTGYGLKKTAKLAEELLNKSLLSYDVRSTATEEEQAILNQLVDKLTPNAKLNQQERRDFYEKCLHEATKTNLHLSVDFRFKGVKLKKDKDFIKGGFAQDEAFIQFSLSPNVDEYTGNLGVKLAEKTFAAEKFSDKCSTDEQPLCGPLDIGEAVDLTEKFFENLSDIPERAKPILDIYTLS